MLDVLIFITCVFVADNEPILALNNNKLVPNKFPNVPLNNCKEPILE